MQEEFFEPKNYTCDFFSDPLIIDMIYFLDQQTTRAQPTTVRKIALFIPQIKTYTTKKHKYIRDLTVYNYPLKCTNEEMVFRLKPDRLLKMIDY